MPIPPFDPVDCVLPPHLGDPRVGEQLSPYLAGIEEVCIRFGTSERRIKILSGFLRLREDLLGCGVRGFQWLGGSFMEDVEWRKDCPPNDVDVVTFATDPASEEETASLVREQPWLLDQPGIKSRFDVDHYLVPGYLTVEKLVERSRYWCGLFSHRRDSLWKGMVQVPLRPDEEEVRAQTALTHPARAVLQQEDLS